MSFSRLSAMMILLALAAACTPVPVDPEEAARECEERARAAQGPTGTVTAGVNSNTGGFAGLEIGITSDFLLGKDPLAVYSDCVWNLTGQAPFRPPEL
ncbi:hypothetical protein JQU17_09025 [Ponticoccus sp. SC2-23]|uniref:hypothetical protein n=1 Tax=Alexandriicola marinus TaxID=2081710 RepID=UPI000FDA4313|nr:hypothetical protein [Alexandriicola marinus]MBM1220172.1 hypothetical protein [Ponticoccus sp. SC6-9]MBM1224858.1 hypothetical protein [Ponticoccus sp. SC6-15]MBM1228372.1 hypothetical protein [Ponticoccus sp. SC6-38]MBM1233991.1 hypothetical protein [Ponticoccus sp. SC6-45]MBM1238873.1 hypothetical protein [Ponticoccus sp. SC6-49]MBM1242655.1 hypothetical protein [Ponticoccus sp. SC2-64]MBM1247515.1 hypothetical protein [Ponticoccus sp. SC6-42]MBM1251826.1 hypothetical protein [Pontico